MGHSCGGVSLRFHRFQLAICQTAAFQCVLRPTSASRASSRGDGTRRPPPSPIPANTPEDGTRERRRKTRDKTTAAPDSLRKSRKSRTPTEQGMWKRDSGQCLGPRTLYPRFRHARPSMSSVRRPSLVVVLAGNSEGASTNFVVCLPTQTALRTVRQT